MPWLRWSWLLLAWATCACTAPYNIPKIENPTGASVQPFNGVQQVAKKGPARVLWVHGMCTHGGAWALDRHKIFAAALDSAAIRMPSDSRTEASDPQRITFNHSIAGNKLEVRYLVWSPLVAKAKGTLLFDKPDNAGGEFPYERASLNNKFKVGLVNDCLADAVVYPGPAGEAVRLWMRAEVCDALGGAFTAPTRCEIPPGVDTTQTVLVAESLGSKILFDAIADIWNDKNVSSKAALAQRLDSMQLIFMLANQLPLLDLAKSTARVNRSLVSRPTPSNATVARLLSALNGARALRARGIPSAPRRIIAFTDPNDLLSYRLTPESAKNVEVTNVIVSNDNTYFGLLERPDTAHCGYIGNPAVLGTIAKGYQGRIAAIDVNAPQSCGW